MKTRFGPTDAGLAEDLHPMGDYLLVKQTTFPGEAEAHSGW